MEKQIAKKILEIGEMGNGDDLVPNWSDIKINLADWECLCRMARKIEEEKKDE